MIKDGEKTIRGAEESVETDDEGSYETLSDRPETASEGSLDDGRIIASRLTSEMLATNTKGAASSMPLLAPFFVRDWSLAIARPPKNFPPTPLALNTGFIAEHARRNYANDDDSAGHRPGRVGSFGSTHYYCTALTMSSGMGA